MSNEGHAVSDLVAFDKWLTGLGISSTTGWRWRRRGLIKTVQIFGRIYISRAAIVEFERRAAADEFKREHNLSKSATSNSGKRISRAAASSAGATKEKLQ